MALEFVEGNILQFRKQAAPTAIVNPVNCVGVMGAGLAKKFKERYPMNFVMYRAACRYGDLEPGGTATYMVNKEFFIINVATKNHWKDKSTIEDVITGLENIVRIIDIKKLQSICIPALGCGLGGLDWEEVKPLFIKILKPIEHTCEIIVYQPWIGPTSYKP